MKEQLLSWYDHRKPEGERNREGYGAFAGLVGLLCNLALVAIKLSVGLLSGSVSVIADAVNNLSDAASSIATLVGFRLSQKPADEEHPFGHARIEYLSGAFIAVVMVLVGVELLKSSIGKIITPEPVSFSVASLLLLALAVAVKAWMRSFYLFVGKRIDSAALHVAARDSRNDIVTTIVVLLGAVLQFFWSLQLDGWLGAAVALFIILSGFLSLRETLSPLLGEAPPKELVSALSRDILGYPGVLGIHDLVVHSYGPGRRFATVHVEMSAITDPLVSHGIIDRIERDLGNRYDLSLVVHYDPVSPPDAETAQIEKEILGIVQTLDPLLSIHDFRIARTTTHTNVIFDLALPEKSKLSPRNVRESISDAIGRLNPTYHPYIQVDRNYTMLPAQETPDKE